MKYANEALGFLTAILIIFTIVIENAVTPWLLLGCGVIMLLNVLHKFYMMLRKQR